MDPVDTNKHTHILVIERSSSCAVENGIMTEVQSLEANGEQYQSSFFNNVILLFGSRDDFLERWCIILGGHNY